MEAGFSDAESDLLQVDRRKAMEELLKGYEVAVHLQSMIIKPEPSSSDNNGSESEVLNPDLVLKILDSFTTTLSMANSGDDCMVFSDDGGTQIQTNTQLSSTQDSGQCCKIPDRKRRKCSAPLTRDITNLNLIDDGYAWRKYGQKNIFGAKYPRSYFRCSFKYDQGCQATKKVQQISDNPNSMYRSIYHGHHTCNNIRRSDQLIMDSADYAADSVSTMISFGHNAADNNIPVLSSFASTNHERSKR